MNIGIHMDSDIKNIGVALNGLSSMNLEVASRKNQTKNLTMTNQCQD